MYLVNHGKSASATLPTQQKSTLFSRVPKHTYAECKISGQQLTQLHKEFPRIHNVGHSKKKRCSNVCITQSLFRTTLDHGSWQPFQCCNSCAATFAAEIWAQMCQTWHLNSKQMPLRLAMKCQINDQKSQIFPYTTESWNASENWCLPTTPQLLFALHNLHLGPF